MIRVALMRRGAEMTYIEFDAVPLEKGRRLPLYHHGEN